MRKVVDTNRTLMWKTYSKFFASQDQEYKASYEAHPYEGESNEEFLERLVEIGKVTSDSTYAILTKLDPSKERGRNYDLQVYEIETKQRTVTDTVITKV